MAKREERKPKIRKMHGWSKGFWLQWSNTVLFINQLCTCRMEQKREAKNKLMFLIEQKRESQRKDAEKVY